MSQQPVIRPVRMDQAPPEVRTLLIDIQDTMGIPWPPDNWRSYAIYPDAARLFWERLKPAVETEQFLTDALRIAELAYRQAQDWYEPGYEPRLQPDVLRRIQWELDAFEYGNAQLLIQQGALNHAVHGEAVGGVGGSRPRRHVSAYRGPEIQMIGEAEASDEIRGLYGDIRQTLSLPLVTSDYQALAKWPAFLEPAWRDARDWREREEYRQLQQNLAIMGDEAGQRLTEAVRIGEDELLAAVGDPVGVNNLQRMVRLFTDLLPGLIVNDALFRIGAGAGRRVQELQPEGTEAPAMP